MIQKYFLLISFILLTKSQTASPDLADKQTSISKLFEIFKLLQNLGEIPGEGVECKNDDSCADGLTCRNEPCPVDRPCGGRVNLPKRCYRTQFANLGEKCDKIQCKDGLTCRNEPCPVGKRSCSRFFLPKRCFRTQFAKPGGKCAGADKIKCEKGSTCQKRNGPYCKARKDFCMFSSGICVEKITVSIEPTSTSKILGAIPSEGVECQNDDSCADGLTCRNEPCPVDRPCHGRVNLPKRCYRTQFANLGEKCAGPDKIQCKDSTCRKFAGPPKPCMNDDCVFPFGECVKLAGENDSCMNGYVGECADGLICQTHGKCGKAPGENAPCDLAGYAGQCADGLICDNSDIISRQKKCIKVNPVKSEPR